MAAWSSVLSFGTHPVVGVIIPAHWHAVAVRPQITKMIRVRRRIMTRVGITVMGRSRVTGLEGKRCGSGPGLGLRLWTKMRWLYW